MKKILTIFVLGIMTLVLFNSCDLLGGLTPVSPEERLADFKDELNTSSRTSIYLHIHPNASMYNQLKASTWWEANAYSTSYINFSFNVSYTSELNNIKTYSGFMTNSIGNYNANITFKEESAGDGIWFISTLSITPDGGGTTIDIY